MMLVTFTRAWPAPGRLGRHRRADPPPTQNRVAALQQFRGLARGGDVRDRVRRPVGRQLCVVLPDRLDDQGDLCLRPSTVAIVSGIRSAPGPRRTITN